MQKFGTSREAKEFLVEKIIEQAQRENTLLSDTEQKMLFFSETHWTIPDMAVVADIFIRNYNPPVYESKIAHLIRNFRAYARKKNPADDKRWKEAILTIKREDHYVLGLNQIATVHPIRNSIWTIFFLIGTILLGTTALLTFYFWFIGNASWWQALLGFLWLSFLTRLCFRLARSRIKYGPLGSPPDALENFHVDF